MSQVSSKNRQLAISKSNNNDDATGNPDSIMKKPLMFAYHGGVTALYGFAIGWQSVSEKSAQLYQLTNPMIRVYGRWRFLTYQNLVIQFVAYSLCLATHLHPRFKKSRDFIFTTLAFPIGMSVVFTFWSIWFVAGRQYIFPVSLQEYYPSWLNHITHTIILPINLIELYIVNHVYSPNKKSYMTLLGHLLSYSAFILYIRFETGRWVYPILNKLDGLPAGAVILASGLFALFCYKSGKIVHDMIHGTVKCVKEKISTNKNKTN